MMIETLISGRLYAVSFLGVALKCLKTLHLIIKQPADNHTELRQLK